MSSSTPPRHPRVTVAEHLAGLEAEAAAFARALAAADLGAPVPACPDWTVLDLAVHLGGVHRWARDAVVTARPGEMPDGPRDPADLLDWYVAGAEAIAATLRTTPPETPCWTFGPKPRTAAFWSRRQHHETWVHRWDLASSAGEDPSGDPAAAVDGVAEVVEMFFPRQVALHRIPPLEGSLALEASDAAGRWVLSGEGTGPASAPDAGADATVRGPADRLLLLLWRRIGPDDASLGVRGSEAAALAVLGAGLTP